MSKGDHLGLSGIAGNFSFTPSKPFINVRFILSCLMVTYGKSYAIWSDYRLAWCVLSSRIENLWLPIHSRQDTPKTNSNQYSYYHLYQFPQTI